MASEWKEKLLGDVLTLQRGFDLPTQDRKQGSIPIVSSSGISGTHSEHKVAGPGVVTGRYGTIGKPIYIRRDFWPLNTTLYVRDFKGNDPRFLYYLLHTLDYEAHNDKSSVPGVNRNHLHLTPVFVPENVKEQHAIADVLGTIDDKIELNLQIIETLQNIARTLFKSWFVDFDPARLGKDGRTSGVPKGVADLYPNSFQDSELGAIPAGWTVGTFADVVEHVRDQDNPLLSPQTIFHHFSIPAFDSGEWPKAELGGSIKSLKTKVPPNVILLSKLNPEIERVWLVDVEAHERAVCSTEFLVLRPRTPFGRAYAYCLARSATFRQHIEALVTGTSKSHQRAQVDSVLQLPVVLPPRPIVKEFEHYCSPFLLRGLRSRRESRTLVGLRETLLPRLISGELRIPSPEKIVGVVT